MPHNFNFSIIHWNVNSAPTRRDEIIQLCNLKKPTIIALQETRLSNKSFYIPGYSWIRQDDGVGVALGVKTPIAFYDRTPKLSDFGCVGVEISLPGLGSNLTIYNFYIPSPCRSYQTMFKPFKITQGKPTILIGDMNAHNKIWGSKITNARGASFQKQIMEEHGFTLLNDGSHTYNCPRNGSKTNIDLSFCSPDMALNFEWTTLDFGTSDHLPIMATLTNHNLSLPNRPQRFAYRRADWDKFTSTIDQEALNYKPLNPDTNSLNKDVVGFIKKGKFAAIPIVKYKTGKPLQPSWWGKETRLAIANLHKARHKMRRTLLPGDRLAYRIAYAASKRATRKAKRENFKNRCAALKKGATLAWVWKLARFEEGQYASIPALKLASNIIVFSNKERATALLKHFFQPTSITAARKEALLLWSGPAPNPNKPYNLPFQQWELDSAIRHLKISAEGPDGIHNLCLKHIPASLKSVVLALINSSLETGTIPEDWHRTNVIPLLKPGKDKSSPAAYRPISLSSCLLKLMERMILKRLEYALTEAGANCKQQFGFKRGSGTTEALTLLTAEAQVAKQNGKVMVIAFLDVQRAFDGVWHEAVIARLQHWSIGGLMLNWISSFLKSRTYQLTIGNHTTTATPTCGVPQGAVLSPRLFSIVIDGMVETLPTAVNGILYADDSTLATVSKSAKVAFTRMQEALDAASNYGKEWGLPCSREKTDYMVISKQRRNTHQLTLTMDGHDLPRVRTKKVLGVVIDSQLNWKEHFQYIKSKTTKSINLLRSLACKSWGADRETLILLYKQLIRARLEYGATSFASATQNQLACLEPIQNKAIRIATGLPYGTSNAALQVESGCPPLQQRRDLAILKTFGKAAANSSPLWTASQGLPHYRWKDDKSPAYIRSLHLLTDLKKINAFDKLENENWEALVPPWTSPVSLSISINWLESKKRNYTSSQLAEMAETEISKFENCKHIYTDGSKTSKGSGIGIFCPNPILNISERCPSELSIMNIELLAIKKSLEQASQLPSCKNILVITDSKSALQLLANQSKSTKSTQTILEMTKKFKSAHFLWVPSHVGISGNEKADKNAEKATNLQIITNTDIPRSDMILGLKDALHSRWKINWANETKGRILYDVNPDILPWKHAVSRTRLEQQILATLRCGRAKLPAHQFRLGKINHPSCPDCGVLGTLHHFLIVCKTYQRQRESLKDAVSKADLAFITKNILGGSQAPEGVNNAILNQLMCFIKETVGYKLILGWE